MTPSLIPTLRRSKAFLLACSLLIGCASQQSIDDIQAQIDSYNAELENNQIAQSEIKAQLVQLEIAGEADSEQATTLRQQLTALIEQQKRQTSQVDKMQATVNANSSAIQAMQAEEEKRKKAVQRLNKSYDIIERKTYEKMRDIEADEPGPEGE